MALSLFYLISFVDMRVWVGNDQLVDCQKINVEEALLQGNASSVLPTTMSCNSLLVHKFYLIFSCNFTLTNRYVTMQLLQPNTTSWCILEVDLIYQNYTEDYGKCEYTMLISCPKLFSSFILLLHLAYWSERRDIKLDEWDYVKTALAAEAVRT